MRNNKHGYVPAALMFDRAIRQMRDHVEYEKFLCRTIKDNDVTKQFKENTEVHPESKYRFMYNSKTVNEHTVAGKKAKKDGDR